MGFFNKKIISFEDKFFALDLSDLSIKIIQLEKDGKIDKIRSYSYLDIPEGNMDDGKIINKEVIADAVRAAIKKAIPKKINTKKVICSLPESKAFLRIISIPKVREDEAHEAIKWEMEANIPLSVDQVYFDWQFLEGSKIRKSPFRDDKTRPSASDIDNQKCFLGRNIKRNKASYASD